MVITIRKKIGNLKIKTTQYPIKDYGFGHYYWVIEDSRGNIRAAGYSGGSPPDILKEKDVIDIFNRWKIDHPNYGRKVK